MEYGYSIHSFGNPMEYGYSIHSFGHPKKYGYQGYIVVDTLWNMDTEYILFWTPYGI